MLQISDSAVAVLRRILAAVAAGILIIVSGTVLIVILTVVLAVVSAGIVITVSCSVHVVVVVFHGSTS